MKISYGICVCNEFIEIQRLISHLIKHKHKQDEIVVIYDTVNGNKEVEEFLRSHSMNNEFIWYPYKFTNNFADLKNYLNTLCNGDYIFQIDADEIPHIDLIKFLPLLLEQNSEIDIFLVPRINTVDGITSKYITEWKWNIDNKGWINHPDYQMRIYKNKPDIRWIKPVHEIIDGFKTFSHLPAEEVWSLYHPKTIERQEKQNAYYNTL